MARTSAISRSRPTPRPAERISRSIPESQEPPSRATEACNSPMIIQPTLNSRSRMSRGPGCAPLLGYNAGEGRGFEAAADGQVSVNGPLLNTRSKLRGSVQVTRLEVSGASSAFRKANHRWCCRIKDPLPPPWIAERSRFKARILPEPQTDFQATGTVPSNRTSHGRRAQRERESRDSPAIRPVHHVFGKHRSGGRRARIACQAALNRPGGASERLLR